MVIMTTNHRGPSVTALLLAFGASGVLIGLEVGLLATRQAVRAADILRVLALACPMMLFGTLLRRRIAHRDTPSGTTQQTATPSMLRR